MRGVTFNLWRFGLTFYTVHRCVGVVVGLRKRKEP